jgi:Holliday junction resolvasome RuvABC endonuclease subunit
MIIDDIKLNINKIDFDLKNKFENVIIEEKSSGNRFYFEISANSEFFNVNENKKFNRVEVKVFINKSDITSSNIKWSYLSNPLIESSHIIERVSKIDSISQDIFEIITEMKMSKDYFDSLEPVELDTMNETTLKDYYSQIVYEFSNIIKEFNVNIINVEKQNSFITEGDSFMDQNPDSIYKIYHNSTIKVSDKFKLESKLKNSNDRINWVLFKEGFIEINYNYIW